MAKRIDLDEESMGALDWRQREKDKGRRNITGRIKRYLAMGAAVAVIGGAGYEYFHDISYWKPRVDCVLGIDSTECLEHRLDGIREGLRSHPGYADRLAREGMEAVKDSGNDFSKETYVEMFGIMKKKFEDKPQLLDYLGPNAMKYEDGRVMRNYKEGMDSMYQRFKKKAIETKDRIAEMFE